MTIPSSAEPHVGLSISPPFRKPGVDSKEAAPGSLAEKNTMVHQ